MVLTFNDSQQFKLLRAFFTLNKCLARCWVTLDGRSKWSFKTEVPIGQEAIMMRILGYSQALLLILCLALVPALTGCKKKIIKSNVKDFGAEVDGGDNSGMEEMCGSDLCPDDVVLPDEADYSFVDYDALSAEADDSAANQNTQEPDGAQPPVDRQTDDPGWDNDQFGPLELTGSASNSTRKIAKANVTERQQILNEINQSDATHKDLKNWYGSFYNLSADVHKHTSAVVGINSKNAVALNPAHVVLDKRWRDSVAFARQKFSFFKNIKFPTQPIQNNSLYWSEVNNYVATVSTVFGNGMNQASNRYQNARRQLNTYDNNLAAKLVAAKKAAAAEIARKNSASPSSSSASSSSSSTPTRTSPPSTPARTSPPSTPTVKPTVKLMYTCEYPEAQFVGFSDSSAREDGRPSISSDGGDSDLLMGLVCRCQRPSTRILSNECQDSKPCGSTGEMWRLGSLSVPAELRAKMPYGDDYPIAMKGMMESECRNVCQRNAPKSILTFACYK